MSKRSPLALHVAGLIVGSIAVLAVVVGVVAATVLAIRSWGVLQGVIAGCALTAFVFGAAAGFISIELS